VTVSPDDANKTQWLKEELLLHVPMLRAYLRGRFPSVPDVDDIVEESVVRVLRAHEAGAVASCKGLLFSTARNLALDLVRRQRVVSFEPMTESSDSYVFTDGTDIVEAVNKKQEFEILTQAIQSLPKRCRQVMTLRTAYGLSQKQIAQKLGISENTVEKQMSTGIRRCAVYFARLGLP